MFITFEGLDFCGKTTQANLLVEQLTKTGNEVLLLREPGGTLISEKIRSILLDLRHEEMSAKAELFLFSAARIQLVNQIIRPALQQGKLVICDRFFDSTTAYQGYGRGINLKEVKAINSIAVEGTIPELTVFISVPIAELLRRQAVKKGIDRMESSGNEFYKRVLEGFEEISKIEPNRFVVIDGTASIETIHQNIWNIIIQRFNIKLHV